MSFCKQIEPAVDHLCFSAEAEKLRLCSIIFNAPLVKRPLSFIQHNRKKASRQLIDLEGFTLYTVLIKGFGSVVIKELISRVSIRNANEISSSSHKN